MEALSLFNTASNSLEKIEGTNGRVRIFVCGPTVQGPMHVGHARTYLTYDVISRILRKIGLETEFVMNITDLDEKILEEAKSKKVKPEELARKQTVNFIRHMNMLGIKDVRYERVSNYIKSMIKYIESLFEKGYAYETNGYVFFDTSKLSCFGYLSHLKREEILLMPTELNEKKRNMLDFSLWKPYSVTSSGINSPWGKGSPGWHIQDTAITLDLFPDGYEIHGGASELIYPHHEAQVAITKALTGKEGFARYWVHTHILSIKGRKMSKSEGNVITVSNMIKMYGRSKLRFSLLSKNYGLEMDYSEIEKNLNRYEKIKKKIGSVEPSEGDETDYLIRIILNNLNTEEAIKRIEKIAENGTLEQKKEVMYFLEEIFGIDFS